MDKTIGIYSFPKSGNTWVRHIVSGALGASPETIPGLHMRPIEEAEYFEDEKSSVLRKSKKVRFYKSHGLHYMVEQKGVKITTNNVLHIRRNPLDVFVSYLNFVSKDMFKNAPIPFSSVEEIKGTEVMEHYLSAFIVLGQVQPFAASGSYFQHNALWLERAEKNKNVKLVRYEDLMDDTYSTLSFLNDWVGLERFNLKEGIENAKSTTKVNGKFFWKQKLKNFQDYLSEEQIERFLKYRSDDCVKLGYEPKFFLE